jgi:hypothetical protein
MEYGVMEYVKSLKERERGKISKIRQEGLSWGIFFNPSLVCLRVWKIIFFMKY